MNSKETVFTLLCMSVLGVVFIPETVTIDSIQSFFREKLEQFQPKQPIEVIDLTITQKDEAIALQAVQTIKEIYFLSQETDTQQQTSTIARMNPNITEAITNQRNTQSETSNQRFSQEFVSLGRPEIKKTQENTLVVSIPGGINTETERAARNYEVRIDLEIQTPSGVITQMNEVLPDSPLP